MGLGLIIAAILIGCGSGGSGETDNNSDQAFSDTQAPSTPSEISATPVSSSTIILSWTDSTDDTGVAGYRIYRDNVEIATVIEPTYTDNNLSPDTQYEYEISAYDAAGNESVSASVNTTTHNSPTDSRIADHTIVNMVRLDQIPVSAIEDAKSNLKIAYGHTSHGSQITSGMNSLDEFKGENGLYTYNDDGSDGAMEFHDYYSNFGGSSTTTTAHDLGNPNRTAWAQATREYLNANPNINVIIWSWCGQAATSISNIDTYINLMEELISEYPSVQFVFMTGHLNGTGLTGSLHLANEHIREHCRNNHRWLFDFADIESYDPDGNYFGDKLADDNCDYDSDGDQYQDANWAIEWQNANDGQWYSCSSAHSQPLNANQKAYAAWWLWARLAGWDAI
jgi:hypothetical protein